MYGPAPGPPARPGTPGKVILLRLLFASFPFWSLGLLAWVPSLRIAMLRRRRLDWAAFVLFAVLSAVDIVAIALVPEEHDAGMTLAGAGFLLLIAAATTHAVLADRFPRTPAMPAAAPPRAHPHPPHPVTPPPSTPPPYPSASPPAASPRMRQVASELDELDDLLRREDRR